MEKIELGNTGEMISCMGLGTMYFGSKVDLQTSMQLLDFYVGRGGSFLDTANKYASWIPGFKGGESEQLIGEWMKLRGNRQELFIASKVGFPYGNIPRSLKKNIIVSECENSLRKLGIEVIDLYYAHASDPETPIDETMEAFYQLKKMGKIRYAGASNFYAWQLCEANITANSQGWEGFTCIQQQHTYLEPLMRTDFGNQLLLTPELQNFCVRKNLGIIAYSPLLGGAYTRNDRILPVQYQNSSAPVRLTRLKKIADELNVSPNVVVLAWMMQGSPRVIPLMAGSSLAQLEENFKALSVRLSVRQIAELNQLPT